MGILDLGTVVELEDTPQGQAIAGTVAHREVAHLETASFLEERQRVVLQENDKVTVSLPLTNLTISSIQKSCHAGHVLSTYLATEHCIDQASAAQLVVVVDMQGQQEEQENSLAEIQPGVQQVQYDTLVSGIHDHHFHHIQPWQVVQHPKPNKRNTNTNIYPTYITRSLVSHMFRHFLLLFP